MGRVCALGPLVVPGPGAGLRAFASFPETQASGAGGASLVAAVGTCVAHAEPEEDGGGAQVTRMVSGPTLVNRRSVGAGTAGFK